MSGRQSRYTIERTTYPNSGFRFLGRNGAGHLVWGSMQLSGHFATARQAAAFINRTGVLNAAVVRHTLH